MNEIKIWAQMFFKDGSVTQGVRVDANILDDDREIEVVAHNLLQSVNRDEGFLLLWGAGELRGMDVTSSSEELDS